VESDSKQTKNYLCRHRKYALSELSAEKQRKECINTNVNFIVIVR